MNDACSTSRNFGSTLFFLRSPTAEIGSIYPNTSKIKCRPSLKSRHRLLLAYVGTPPTYIAFIFIAPFFLFFFLFFAVGGAALLRARGLAQRKIRLGDRDDAGSPRLHFPHASVEELQTRGGGGREGRQQLLRARGIVPPESVGPPAYTIPPLPHRVHCFRARRLIHA